MSLTSSGEIKISQIQSELDYASNRVNASLKSLGNYGRIELEMKEKENVCE